MIRQHDAIFAGGTWRTAASSERLTLERIADAVEARRDEIGTTVSREMGAPFAFARRANADGVAHDPVAVLYP